MRILFISILLIFLAFQAEVMSQSATTRKGDKLFVKGEYFEALELYKKAEAEGVKLDTKTLINKAICFSELNAIDEAFNIFFENADKLEGNQIYIYAQLQNKVGFYDGAIEYYEKAKAAGANPSEIDELIASCRWAAEHPEYVPNVLVNPVGELYTGGQSFGIQFYKKGVVYSSVDEAATSSNVDKQGLKILNLFSSELVDKKVQPSKKVFSKNLVFPTHVGAISFTSDNAMMYYSRVVRVKGGDSQVKIFSVEFNGKDWGSETELPMNSDDYSCAQPAVSPDNRILYFVSNKSGGYGGKDIYYCERSKSGDLGEVRNLGSTINTFGDEQYPFVSKDNILYFSSDGRKGFGGLDIFSATKSGDKWGNVTNLMQPFNGSKDDFGYVLDPSDSNFGFLSSNRIGTGQNDAIFSVQISPVGPVNVDVPIEIPKDTVVVEVAPPIVIPAVAITVEVPVVTPTVVPKEEPNVEPIVTPKEEPPVVVAPSNLPKEFNSTIISTFNGTPLEGVSVVIKDLATNLEIGNALSSTKGKFVISIPPVAQFEGREFELSFSKGEDFNSKKMIVNIQEIEDLNKNGLSMTPIFHDAVLDDISGMVIPYLGNEITPEGAKVLDNLAAYMVKNPNIVIKLNGHTEARGDKLNNLKVSQIMAEKAETLLIKAGIRDENIIPRSYGERYIINKCKRGTFCDNSTHLKNRRIEVVVWRVNK